ncbi:MAG: LacI family transcriptional regulator [Solirubrobacteraceae bacterium]|nr:LacI family transcriptional regulator [Solirubrobacteraceae bacterium]
MVDRPKSGTSRPTLSDVAAAAGVSRATASRALGTGGHVSPAARKRVVAAAARLAFEPNQLARSLRRGSTMAIGMVVPDVANAFYAAALRGAHEVLEDAGYHVLVVNTDRTAGKEREALHSLRSHQVDGLIVASYGGYEDIGVPAAFFDDVPAATAGVGAVALDNREGIGLLVDHLVTVHGHRRIAYLGPPATVNGEDRTPRVFVGRERLDAFRDAAGRAGVPVPPDYVRLSDPTTWGSSARVVAGELLSLDSPPTAILAGTDTMAIGVLEAAREQAARIPEDVALVSFDEPMYADLLDPPITSLDRHDRDLGRRVAQILLDALSRSRVDGSLPSGGETVRVPLGLRIRRSCGC